MENRPNTDAEIHKKKVLIIAYKFPPLNQIAAVRTGKFAKYLPSFGWQPIVLTANIGKMFPQTLPVETDEANIIRTSSFTLARAASQRLAGKQPVSSANHIVKNRIWKKAVYITLRLGDPIYKLPLVNILLSDPIGWYRSAVKKGLEIINKNNIDVIFSSYGPATAHLIASQLHNKTGVPWVAEFRDLWTSNPYNKKTQPFYWLGKIMERKVMKGSSLLITVSEPMAQQLAAFHGKKVITIHNGFDTEDYVSVVPPTEKFTITYTGQISVGKRDPTPLFKAIAELAKEGKVSSANFEVRFFGNYSLESLVPIISIYDLGSLVRIYGFVPFKESVERQKESTSLLLLTWVDAKETGVYTGKLFEYLGARKPILAIGQKGSVVDKLLLNARAGITCSEPSEIKAVLSKWLEESKQLGSIRSQYAPCDVVISQYTRKEGTSKLAQALEAVVAQEHG